MTATRRQRFRTALAFALGGLLVWSVEAANAACAGSGVFGL